MRIHVTIWEPSILSSDHQSIYIGVPVARGYRRKRRRRRSSREAADTERDRRYSQRRRSEQERYEDIDMEEGLMDSNEQSLQDISCTGKSVAEEPQKHGMIQCWSFEEHPDTASAGVSQCHTSLCHHLHDCDLC